MASSEVLGIYLEDHHGGSSAGVELAERLRREHEGTPFGTVMLGLVADIKQDRKVLEELIERVEADKSAVKQAAGWVAEKAARLRLNPAMTGSSELTTLMQIETLSLGIEGKRLLWLVLARVAERDERLAGIDFDRLIGRAESQRETLESYRLDAGSEAFARAPSSHP
jgi:hypothetical protein